jgi:hypothetical protein
MAVGGLLSSRTEMSFLGKAINRLALAHGHKEHIDFVHLFRQQPFTCGRGIQNSVRNALSTVLRVCRLADHPKSGNECKQ